MKRQSVKRINVFLTEREVKALDQLEEEMTNRNLNMNMSDIIRDAILDYCKTQTGTSY